MKIKPFLSKKKEGVRMLKTYKIAGLTVRMDTFGKTEKQAEKFECDHSDSCDIAVDGERFSKVVPEELVGPDSAEYMRTGADFYNKLLNFDGMLLHSSAVVYEGKAYLFTAPSGTGKSTHTRLWCENFEGAFILNDDKPALRSEDGVWYAYGTPWSGKTNLNVNLRVPLGGIAVVERNKDNSIVPLKGRKALFAILNQTVRPHSSELRLKLTQLLSDLLTEVPVWLLRCNTDKEAAFVSKEAMTRFKKDDIYEN